MSGPLVTVGMPVYQGKDWLFKTLTCVKEQTYPHLDVLISVDGADEGTLAMCQPFLRDPRFRLYVQPSRLGWAENTSWTMRQCRGEFYVYQQQDDLPSPTYVADLVKAASRWPQASICFAELRVSGPQNITIRDKSVLGPPVDRALFAMEQLRDSMLGGLIRASALTRTSALRANEFEGFGSQNVFLAELALAGEFRFVDGPACRKLIHGRNLTLTYLRWPETQKRAAWACLAARMIPVIVPAGANIEERWRLFETILDRFLTARGWLSWLRNRSQLLREYDFDDRAIILRRILDLLRRGGYLDDLMSKRTRYMFCHIDKRDHASRAEMLRAIVDRLRTDGNFEPDGLLSSTWLEMEERLTTSFKVSLRRPKGAAGERPESNGSASH